MYKAIIYNNNLKLIKRICNILLGKLDNIKLIGITSNIEELTDMLNHNKINMIIVSECGTKKLENLSLFKNIENKIIFCQNPQNFRNSKYILHLPLECNDKYLQKEFQKFILKINARSVRKKVYKIMERLNFDFKLIGTNYLLEAIVYSYINKEKYLFENLTQEVYPYIAKIYNVKPDNVKWSIVRSVNSLKFNSNLNELFSNYCEKITPKTLISEIVNRI